MLDTIIIIKMNLFDYIADSLTPEQKRSLYRERSICLCLFRVAFGTDTHLEGEDPVQAPPGLQ